MVRRLKVLVASAALLSVAAPAVALAQVSTGVPQAQVQTMTQLPSINLSARGEVKVAPDQASLNFGVVTEAQTAQEAMAQNARQMAQVMAALKRSGLADRDIQTSGLNLSAQYDYQQNEPPKLRGYQASNRVTVVIGDLTKVGTTADAVVAAGVNQIDGISFGLKDPKAAEDQARQLAVRALQDKANLYAQALGVRLGGLRSFSEGVSYNQPRPPVMFARAAAMEVSHDATSVEAGELSISIDVSAIYDVQP